MSFGSISPNNPFVADGGTGREVRDEEDSGAKVVLLRLGFPREGCGGEYPRCWYRGDESGGTVSGSTVTTLKRGVPEDLGGLVPCAISGVPGLE